uniref:Chemokine (C-C motif) receptor 11.1 n=2 Tax=Cynoglossus semilaevis TaxID=244447 RepID=A0A3P8VQG8_CYNSE
MGPRILEIFVPTLYSLVFILGFLGNGLVVCVLLKHRHQTNLTDICLLTLALSDLVFVLTLPFFAHFAAYSEWVFGGFMCSFLRGSHYVGFFSSIFFMVAMTLDRYVSIMHANKMIRCRTLRSGVILSICIWLLSFCVSLPAFIFSHVQHYSYSICVYAPDDMVWKFYDIFATCILGLVLPMLAMVVCYSRIIPTLLSMRSTKKHHAVRLIILIVVVFFIFWFPFNISMLLDFLQVLGKLPFTCELQKNLYISLVVTESLAYTHCCLNPIIYAFAGQKFMKRACRLLKTWVPWIPLADFPDSSFRKSSVRSRSSEVTTISFK